MKKEQYKFCIDFYELCDRYLINEKKLEDSDEWKNEQVRLKFFRKLKKELENLLDEGNIVKNADIVITDDFYYAYDLAEMLHTYIDCIPEDKTYLLMELFTFLKKYKTKIEEKDSLNEWQIFINSDEKKITKNDYNIKKIKRKIIELLILTGAITAGALFAQTETCQKMFDKVTEIVDDDKPLTLERKK